MICLSSCLKQIVNDDRFEHQAETQAVDLCK